MKFLRKLKLKPLTLLMFLSFLGFIFFSALVVLVIIYYEVIREYLKTKYGANLDDMRIFLILAGIHSIAFLVVTIQLFLAKPTSLKVMLPIIIITTTAFILLIAIDFYIEFHLMHVTPKDQYANASDKKKHKKDGKDKGKGFKLGFLIIYINMCIVTWFLYLAYKDLEEELDNEEEFENPPMEIVISHIT